MGTTRPVFETCRILLDPPQPVSSCQTSVSIHCIAYLSLPKEKRNGLIFRAQIYIYILGHSSDAEWFTVIHTLMVVAAMQDADQHIRSSLACRPGDSNQRPSDNKTLALPLSYSRPRHFQCSFHQPPYSVVYKVLEEAWLVQSATGHIMMNIIFNICQ